MEKVIYDVLEKLENNSYEAYVVGGYVRDMLLGEKSYDIDIATLARPKEILSIFPSNNMVLHEYGNVSFEIEDFKFDITTFRKDIKYKNNRKPERIVYIDSFNDDLKRRDFTINAICLDKTGKIIDLYDGRSDLKRKVIRSIGDPYKKMEEDALRMLRAVRFATVLKFKIDPILRSAIEKNKHLLRSLSYGRKREELNKIFSSKNKKYGIKILKELGLLEDLELKNIKYVLHSNDLIGIWSMITDVDYAFTKKEKDIIKNVKLLMNEDINDVFVNYKYGSYAVSIVSDLKGLNTKKVMANYDKLPIKDKNEIAISVDEICNALNRKPDSFLKDIISDIERKILKGDLSNNKEELEKYIKSNY